MLIYNVTTKVDWSIADDWLEWMKEEHIPAVMNSGCFERHHLVKLLEVDDEEGPTYAAQYFANSRLQYDEYIDNYASKFRGEVISKWGNKFIAFRTLMEIVDQSV